MAGENDLLENLQIPEQQPAGSGALDLRPRKLSAWIEGLPLANVGETARQVYHALNELTHTSLDPQDRFKDLELLREPVQYVTESVRRHFAKESFPLPPKRQRAAELARTLPGKMALGYKAVLFDNIAHNGRSDHKLVVRAVHRTLRYLGETLLRSYEAYAQYPGGLWREAHALYTYAERSGFERTEVKDGLLSAARSQSAGDAYKQILLLGLACPYRLYQGEVVKVYHALEGWAPHATLGPCEANGEGGYVVALDTDTPPFYSDLTQLSDTTQCRHLDPSGLTHLVRQEMARSQRETATPSALKPNGLDADLLRRLMLVWGMMPKRRFTRTRKQGAVMAAIGLTASYHFIEAHSPDDEPGGVDHLGNDDDVLLAKPASFTSAPARGTYGRVPDVWEMPYRGGQAEEQGSVVLNTAKGHPDRTYTVQLLRLLNVSAGGHCLLWDRAECCKARVGEVVSIRDTDEGHPGQSGVGAIRWMKYNKSRGLEFGIQLLAPTAIAVAIRAGDDPRSTEYTRGLLLPEIPSLGQPATLLTPPLPYHVEQVLVIHAQGAERRVRLTSLMENTGAFAQFRFEHYREDSRPTSDEGEATAAGQEFEELWTEL